MYASDYLLVLIWLYIYMKYLKCIYIYIYIYILFVLFRVQVRAENKKRTENPSDPPRSGGFVPRRSCVPERLVDLALPPSLPRSTHQLFYFYMKFSSTWVRYTLPHLVNPIKNHAGQTTSPNQQGCPRKA